MNPRCPVVSPQAPAIRVRAGHLSASPRDGKFFDPTGPRLVPEELVMTTAVDECYRITLHPPEKDPLALDVNVPGIRRLHTPLAHPKGVLKDGSDPLLECDKKGCVPLGEGLKLLLEASFDSFLPVLFLHVTRRGDACHPAL